MDKHQTPLGLHFKQKHTWYDISLLGILWVLVFLVPENLWEVGGISALFFLKITALVASLEFIGFLSFHLLNGKISLLLQGFLGGFISSTTVYVQLNYDKRFENVEEKLIAESLLIAICSMLIECLLIIVSVSKDFSLPMLLPFALMLLFISVFLLFSISKNNKENYQVDGINNLEIDDPIVWKKVLIFSFYIALLKLLMIVLQKFTNIPVIVATFLASLFEAHAILAVNATNFSKSMNLSDIFMITSLILLGSLLSKMFLVLRGKVLEKKRLILLPITVSTLLTFLGTYLFHVLP